MAEKKSRRKIMDAAAALFRERGYDATSIADICKAAGCSVSTFYYQFESKAALIGEMFSRSSALTDERVAQVLACDSPWEQLFLIHSSFTNLYQQMGVDLSIQILSLLMNWQTAYRDLPDTVYTCNLVVPIIRRGQQCGEIRNPAPPEELMLSVWTMINGVLFTWAADGGTYDATERLRMALEILYDIPPALRRAAKQTETPQKAD